jgi:ParB/RepB/Spo0J family partition protein
VRTQSRAQLREIRIDRIDLPARPARRFMGDISSLAESMQAYGLQQPISVRVQGERFVVTSGTRRLAASRLLEWATIDAFVRSVSADDAYVVDLIENLQRQDLSPEEEADAFGELLRTRGWTLQQVADAVKRSVGYISKRVRVFDNPDLRQAVVTDGLPISTAEELLAAEPTERAALIARALAERWDQVQARNALRGGDTTVRALAEGGALPRRRAVAETASHDGTVESSTRPKGLTSTIRQFHKLIIELRTDELTHADLAAFRSLFRDLVLLARASTTQSAPVFPPLPTSPARASRQSGASRPAARTRQPRLS